MPKYSQWCNNVKMAGSSSGSLTARSWASFHVPSEALSKNPEDPRSSPSWMVNAAGSSDPTKTETNSPSRLDTYDQ